MTGDIMWRNVFESFLFPYVYFCCSHFINIKYDVYHVNIFKVECLRYSLFANCCACVIHAQYSVKVW